MGLTRRTELRLRGLSLRCMRRAADSLGQLVGHPLRLGVASVDSVATGALADLTGGVSGRELAAIQFDVRGAGSGHLLVVFPLTTVRRLLERLVPIGPADQRLSPLEESAVQEMGNVLASAFLSELGDLVGYRFLPSPPRIRIERIEELARELEQSLGRAGGEVVVVQAEFEDPDAHIEGQFFVFPDMDSIALLERVGEGE